MNTERPETEELEDFEDEFEQDETISDTGIEETEEISPRIQFPFDPNLVLFSTQQQSLQMLLEKVEYKELNLNPDWQRMGNIWKFDKKCRLIESLLLRIPIPAFYMYIEDKGNKEYWSVIDGLQRLSILNHFIYGIPNSDFTLPELEKMQRAKEVIIKGEKNFLTLKNLQYLNLIDIADKTKVPETRIKQNNSKNDKNNKESEISDYEYLLYEELDSSYQRIIKGTQVTVFGIRLRGNVKTKEKQEQQQQVIYNIFERINTGGLPLSPQEIRHAIKQGKSTQLIKELAESKEFKEATNYKIKPLRMEDRELVLRYLYFHVKGFEKKRLSQKDFNFILLSFMDEINQEKENSKLEKWKHDFLVSMRRAKQLFGEFAFTRIRKNKKGEYRPYIINKALFETISVNLSKLSDSEFESILIQKENFMKEYFALYNSKDEINGITFNDSISRSTTDVSSIERRFKAIEELFKRYSK